MVLPFIRLRPHCLQPRWHLPPGGGLRVGALLRATLRLQAGALVYAAIMAMGLLSLAGCAGSAPVTSAADAGESITFTTEDGVALSGRLFGSGAETGVVLAHMYPKDQSSWYEFARLLAREGYMALAFDFRGYGTSTGEKRIDRIDRDVAAAIMALTARGARRVFVVGASMGGTAALIAAVSESLAGIVAVSAPAEFQGLDARQAVSSSSCPKLFIAAEGDQAASSCQSLFQLANEPKEIVLLPGSAHGSDLFKGKEGARAQKLVLDFLAANSKP